MEALVASAVGVMTAAGIFLILRRRTFPVILGLSLLTYAVNVFLFATGRLALNAPAVLNKYKDVPYTDPLPQALVLTAIVISMGGLAFILSMLYIISVRYKTSDLDQVDGLKR